MTTTAELGYWVNTAARGETMVYARSSEDHRPASGVLAAARKLHDLGLIVLVQRREPDGSIAYIAQRTFKRPDTTPARRPGGCATPGCVRPVPERSTLGLCRPCNINAARKRRRAFA